MPNIEIAGHIIAAGITNYQGIGSCLYLAIVDVGSRSVGGSGFESVALRQSAHADVGAMRLAVVGEGAARGGNYNLAGILTNSKFADILFIEFVVGLLGVAIPLNFIGIIRRANLSLRAGYHKASILAINESLDLAASGKGFSIISFISRASRNLIRTRRNLVSPGNGAGVVALAGDGHGDRARHVGEVVGVVGDLVVNAFLEGLALGVLDLGGPLVLGAVVGLVIGAVNLNAAVIGVWIIRIGTRIDVLGSNPELTLVLGDAVVVLVELLACSVGDGIGYLALGNIGDSTRSGNVTYFAINEAFARRGDVGLGQRRAVVNLGSTLGLKNDATLVNRKRAVLHAHLELISDIILVCIGHNGRANNIVGVGARIGLSGVLGRKPGNGIGLAVNDEARSLKTNSRVLLTIVGSGSGIGLYGNLILSFAVSDIESSVLYLNLVVLLVCAAIQFIGKQVFRRTGNGLAAGNLIGCALSIDKTVARNTYFTVSKRLAVVFLFLGARG